MNESKRIGKNHRICWNCERNPHVDFSIHVENFKSLKEFSEEMGMKKLSKEISPLLKRASSTKEKCKSPFDPDKCPEQKLMCKKPKNTKITSWLRLDE